MRPIVLSDQNRRNAVIASALVLSQVALIFCVVRWLAPDSAYNRNRRDLAAIKRAVQDDRALIGREEALLKDLGQSELVLGSVIQYAPAKSDRYAWAYEYVSRRASQAGLTLNTVEEVLPDSKDTGGDVRPFELCLFTRCGYNNLVEFLWRLEKDNLLLRIKKVSIDTVPGITVSPTVQVSVQWLTSLEVAHIEK